MIRDQERSRDYIIPSVFNKKVGKRVAAAVARVARESGVARRLPAAASFIH